MNKKNKQILGTSLLLSGFAVLATMMFVPSKDKKTSRVLSFIALISGVVGFLLTSNLPKRFFKTKERVADDGELFEEEDLDDTISVIHAELSDTEDGEATPKLNIEIPCDEEATEEDFI